MQDLNEVPLRLSTRDGDVDVTAKVDSAGDAWLRSAMAGKNEIEIELRPSEDEDVRAHQAGETSVVVTINYPGGGDDDVEGHAMSLHFPSMEAAKDFERKLLATGLIAGTVAISIVGVNAASQPHLGSGAQALPGAAPTVQYAPATHDMDHDLSISIPAPVAAPVGHVGLSELAVPSASVSTGTHEHVGLSEAAATGAATQYAPTVRDTDHDISGISATGAATQYAPTVRDTDHDISGISATGAATQDALAMREGDRGYMSAAGAAAASSQDVLAPHGGYMTAAGAAAASPQDALAMRAADRGYMTAAAAAAASASGTEEHVGLSEQAAAGAATTPTQYAPTIRDRNYDDGAAPAAPANDEQQLPGDRRL